MNFSQLNYLFRVCWRYFYSTAKDFSPPSIEIMISVKFFTSAITICRKQQQNSTVVIHLAAQRTRICHSLETSLHKQAFACRKPNFVFQMCNVISTLLRVLLQHHLTHHSRALIFFFWSLVRIRDHELQLCLLALCLKFISHHSFFLV